MLLLAVKTINASVSGYYEVASETGSTFWFIFENSPIVQFNTTRSQYHAQPQNGQCLLMCSAAKAGERALPTTRTTNGKRRSLRKSNRLQEFKGNKRKRSAYNWQRKWEGRTLINCYKREEITVEPHKYKDTRLNCHYDQIVTYQGRIYTPPPLHFVPGSFFFCKRVSDGTSSYIFFIKHC